jgi:hypothetical protein
MQNYSYPCQRRRVISLAAASVLAVAAPSVSLLAQTSAAQIRSSSAPSRAAAAPSLEVLHRNFANPPNQARPMVRWWWFGLAVVKPEILRELQQMKADGIQGAEMAFEYPIVLDDPAKGLKNLPFLSPEMLDDVRYAQEEGRKLGLRIDVTLGSGWPYGGPNTPLSQASSALHTVTVDVPANATSAMIPPGPANRPNWTDGDSVISAVITEPAKLSAEPGTAAPGRGGRGGGGRNLGPRPPAFDPASAKPASVSGKSASFAAADHPRVAVFFIASHTKQMVKRAAVDADGYVLDSFSHESVANHLQKVGEPILKAFGATPPYAIFSDSLEAYGSDWTPNLPAEFLKRRGYDLIPHLPELVAGGTPQAENIRHDYGVTLTELINDNYLRQVTAWAVAHHTKFRSQTYGEPAVDFSSQNLASLPEGEGPQWRAFSTLRWATSANHVFRNPVTSGETFTWLHSPVFRATPLDMKAEADIDFIMGENQIVCHGWPYSPPDHEVPEPGWSLYAAAVFNDHNPWHPVMPAVTSYIGRMSWLLRQGQPANQVAILLPEDDIWSTFSPTHTTVTGALGPHISPLMPPILSAGYNVDFIDAEAVDKVGLGTHQILVIPSTDRIPLATLHKITAWAQHGGHVIAIGKLPTLDPEGKPLNAADTAAIPLIPDVSKLPEALHNAAPPDFNIDAANEGKPAPGDTAGRFDSQVGFIHRKLPNADVYFVANTSNEPVQAFLTLATRFKGGQAWNTDTGAASSITKEPLVDLAPYESRVFVFSDSLPRFEALPNQDKNVAKAQMSGGSERLYVDNTTDISSDWKVNFVGDNKTVDEATLKDWTADPSTLHYSGEAIYSRDVTLKQPVSGPVYLEVLGGSAIPGAPNGPPERDAARPEVLGANGLPNPLITRPGPGMHAWYDPPIREAALVTINGQAAGALWHPPYRLDVGKLLKPGVNHIEIKVYNTALNAWSALPPRDYGPLIAKYGDRFQMQDLNQVKPISSGLLGTVHLTSGSK